MSQTLADVFEAVAHKRLVLVDLPGGSHQHELNGKKVFQEFFASSDRVEGDFTWHYFSDDHEVATEDSTFTWYDSRLKGAERTGRSEWRFYYHDNFLAVAEPGDELFLVRTTAGAVHALIFKEGSAKLRSARLLFGVTTASDQIQLIPDSAISKQDLELVRRQIIEELGLDIALPVASSDRELVLGRFGEQFPTTAIMSAFAREQIRVDGSDADAALVAWLDREEQLFRALEEVIIGKRIKQAFDSVDDFIQFSLTVQNRRKSRMGHALQHHLTEVFTRHKIQFKAQAKTEGGNKPDFIFPGEAEYHAPSFDASLLLMLGVKSSAKDRWRQILPEAARIKDKHLCTLQPGISENQTDQMANERVQLVIPSSVHATYTDAQRAKLLSVSGFIDLVRSKQA
jgi:hypothetical protein